MASTLSVCLHWFNYSPRTPRQGPGLRVFIDSSCGPGRTSIPGRNGLPRGLGEWVGNVSVDLIGPSMLSCGPSMPRSRWEDRFRHREWVSQWMVHKQKSGRGSSATKTCSFDQEPTGVSLGSKRRRLQRPQDPKERLVTYTWSPLPVELLECSCCSRLELTMIHTGPVGHHHCC